MRRSQVGTLCAAALAIVIGASHAKADEPARAPEPRGGATTPAAAVQPAAGSQSLDGIWMFDQKRSDDPRKVMESARGSGGGEGGRRWGGGGGMGEGMGGFGGGMGGGHRRGGGGYGGGDEGGRPPGGEDAEGGGQDRRGPGPFARVMRPAKKVVIEMLADQVNVTEDEGAPRPYAIQDSLKAHGHDLVTQGTTARWKSGRLEMAETSTGGRGGSLVETYELSKDGMTLTIRAHREGGQEGMPNPVFTRVYTRYTGD